MEMDLQAEKYQTVEEDTQVVEAEPDNNEDSPEEERTYSQAEVEEIIREHLLRFQSLPVQETQQTTELTWEKKFYLGQKIRKYADRFGHQGISTPPPKLIRSVNMRRTSQKGSMDFWMPQIWKVSLRRLMQFSILSNFRKSRAIKPAIPVAEVIMKRRTRSRNLRRSLIS